MSATLSTLAAPCQHRAEIKKSRFLASAGPVTSIDETLTFLRNAFDSTATHHCWAYRIGQDYRFSDDGEPGGTAGRPILQAIEHQRMDGVMVVVTRWYGGIKLGAGGLARAYGGTAAECLRVAERVPIVAMTRLQVHVQFAELALLKARLRELDGEVESEQFNLNGVELHLHVPDGRAADAEQLIRGLTRGRSVAKRLA